MVVRDPPYANDHKAQELAEEFWRHRQQAAF